MMEYGLRAALMVSVVTLLGACQAPMQAGSQCVVEAGYLDNESTFNWYAGQSLDLQDSTGFVGPLAVRALEESVQAELAAKGFSFVETTQGESNVQVQLTLRTRRELVSFETGGSPCHDVDCWERIEPGAGTRMDIRTIGFLAADVFHQGEPIWRGWVETTLYPSDRDAAGEVIARAVPKLFESFPP
ncbi:MAG: DUF4136 domain-containing protein [Pseudomonadota bacterium]